MGKQTRVMQVLSFVLAVACGSAFAVDASASTSGAVASTGGAAGAADAKQETGEQPAPAEHLDKSPEAVMPRAHQSAKRGEDLNGSDD